MITPTLPKKFDTAAVTKMGRRSEDRATMGAGRCRRRRNHTPEALPERAWPPCPKTRIPSLEATERVPHYTLLAGGVWSSLNFIWLSFTRVGVEQNIARHYACGVLDFNHSGPRGRVHRSTESQKHVAVAGSPPGSTRRRR